MDVRHASFDGRSEHTAIPVPSVSAVASIDLQMITPPTTSGGL